MEKQINRPAGIASSRRNFFSQFAVGAAMSMIMPGLAQAANRSQQQPVIARHVANSARSGVRLPNRQSVKARYGDHRKTGRAAIHKVNGKQQSQLVVEANESDFFGHRDNPAGFFADSRPVDSMQPASRQTLFSGDSDLLPSYRSLAVQNPHTGDKLSLTYFEQGRYLSDALDEISFLLRDYRSGDVHPIDPELLDQLHDLKQMLGLNQAFEVICGYRSPLTNAKLHAERTGVASNSFHMYGRAVDIRLERYDLRRLHHAALAMHRGGVGFYPESNFIHLDTGTFRNWVL